VDSRILLTASALALLATTGAMAADAIVEEPVPVVEFFSWTGGYVGLQGGYAWADADIVDEFDFDIGSEAFNGGLLGLYAGYNWQSGAWVFGGEADINWVSNEEEFFVPVGDDVYGVEVGTDYLASLRARIGYAWDRTLVFATGGIAFTEVGADASSFNGLDFDDVELASESATGWTLGLGIEHAFTDNWLGRFEYRYYDFGDSDLNDFNDLGGSVEVQVQTATVGIAYKW